MTVYSRRQTIDDTLDYVRGLLEEDFNVVIERELAVDPEATVVSPATVKTYYNIHGNRPNVGVTVPADGKTRTVHLESSEGARRAHERAHKLIGITNETGPENRV